MREIPGTAISAGHEEKNVREGSFPVKKVFALLPLKFAAILLGCFLSRGIFCFAMLSDHRRGSSVHSVLNQKEAGCVKFGFFQCLKFAVNGIVLFSVRPLFLCLWLAVLSGLFALTLGGLAIIKYPLPQQQISVCTPVISTIVLMASINLFVLVIIAASIGKIHMEIRHCPAGALRTHFSESLKSGRNAHAGDC